MLCTTPVNAHSGSLPLCNWECYKPGVRCGPVISNAASSALQVDGGAPVGKDFMTTPPCITTETISTTMVSGTRRLLSLTHPSYPTPQQPELSSCFRKSSAALTVVRQMTRFLFSGTLAALVHIVSLWFAKLDNVGNGVPESQLSGPSQPCRSRGRVEWSDS